MITSRQPTRARFALIGAGGAESSMDGFSFVL